MLSSFNSLYFWLFPFCTLFPPIYNKLVVYLCAPIMYVLYIETDCIHVGLCYYFCYYFSIFYKPYFVQYLKISLVDIHVRYLLLWLVTFYLVFSYCSFSNKFFVNSFCAWQFIINAAINSIRPFCFSTRSIINNIIVSFLD